MSRRLPSQQLSEGNPFPSSLLSFAFSRLYVAGYATPHLYNLARGGGVGGFASERRRDFDADS